MADELTVPPSTPKSKCGASSRTTCKTTSSGPSKSEMPVPSRTEVPMPSRTDLQTERAPVLSERRAASLTGAGDRRASASARRASSMSGNPPFCTCGATSVPEPPPEPLKPKAKPKEPATLAKACEKVTKAEEKLAQERKEQENECKEMASRYSLPTRIGFWFDNAASAELQAEAYRAKYQDCKTLKQLVYQVHDYLFDVRKVAKFNPVVFYNTPMQLLSEIKRENPENLVLSTLITERQIVENNLLTLREGCTVTMTHETQRLRRNVFVLIPVNRSEEISPVMYGDHFFIRLVDDPLYVLGDLPNLDNIGGYGDKIPVILTDIPSRFCKFQVLHPNNETNMDVMGTEVPTFTTLVINQVISNQNLDVILDSQIVTMFSRDFAVACHSSPAPILRKTWSNYWQFTTMTEEETRAELDQGSN